MTKQHFKDDIHNVDCRKRKTGKISKTTKDMYCIDFLRVKVPPRTICSLVGVKWFKEQKSNTLTHNYRGSAAHNTYHRSVRKWTAAAGLLQDHARMKMNRLIFITTCLHLVQISSF